MEDKISKGGNYKRLQKGSKREHGNSGPENFVHPPFKISGSAPAFHCLLPVQVLNICVTNACTLIVLIYNIDNFYI